MIKRGYRMKEKTFITFLNDDDQKKEYWVVIKEKNISYVSFEYNDKIITVPWHRVLKIKEPNDD